MMGSAHPFEKSAADSMDANIHCLDLVGVRLEDEFCGLGL
jgi:hypothetical protein